MLVALFYKPDLTTKVGDMCLEGGKCVWKGASVFGRGQVCLEGASVFGRGVCLEGGHNS